MLKETYVSGRYQSSLRHAALVREAAAAITWTARWDEGLLQTVLYL